MLHFRAPKQLIAFLAVAVVALPVFAVPASAAPGPARLDDEVSQRLQITADAQTIPVIVEGSADGDGTGRALRAETRVRSGGGIVVGSSSLLGASVAELTPAQIRALAADPLVGRIHIDSEVKATDVAEPDATPGGGTPIVFQAAIGATDAWKAGFTGQGVTVAILDTGIDNTTSVFGARVKARVDLVDPAHPAPGDPAGHGTHLAGIVAAGRDAPSPGIAPDADLVSVRVLDKNGSSRLSTVIRGLEWVIAHKSALGIRVVVMALGAPTHGGYQQDPLAGVAEIAWRSGLVLVTAAGNDGPGARTIETPGIDPLVLTVGASDDNGTVSAADDSIPFWSSVGPTTDGLAKPELVAPGRKIVSVRVPGSTLDVQNPTHVEGPTTIRFSGTSESTAVVGGSAALLLQQRPGLSPDETKALLVGGARPLAGIGVTFQGAGLINVQRALGARTPQVVRPHLFPAEGLVRALLPLMSGLGWQPDGHQFGNVNQGISADQVRWDQVRWDQVRWDQVRWDQVRWDQVRWDQVRWDQVRWDQVRWDHVRWDGTIYD